MNQLEVAKRAGISNGALSRIENGHVRPHLSTIEDLAAVLKLDYSQLVRLAEQVSTNGAR